MKIEEHNFIDFIINEDGLSCLFDNKLTSDHKVLLISMLRGRSAYFDKDRMFSPDGYISWRYTGQIAHRLGLTRLKVEEAIVEMKELGVIEYQTEVDEDGKYHEFRLSDLSLDAMFNFRNWKACEESDKLVLEKMQDMDPDLYLRATASLFPGNRPLMNIAPVKNS